MDPISELLERLSSLDPPLVVLRPEEAETPNQYSPLDSSGKPQAGKQGLSYWMATKPLGYVQLYESTPLFSDGFLDTVLFAIDVIAPTRALAKTQAARVRVSLGDPIRDGSKWQHLDTQFLPLERGAYRVQMTFQTTEGFDFYP